MFVDVFSRWLHQHYSIEILELVSRGPKAFNEAILDFDSTFARDVWYVLRNIDENTPCNLITGYITSTFRVPLFKYSTMDAALVALIISPVYWAVPTSALNVDFSA